MSGDCGHMGTRGDGVASEEETSGAGPMAGPLRGLPTVSGGAAVRDS